MAATAEAATARLRARAAGGAAATRLIATLSRGAM